MTTPKPPLGSSEDRPMRMNLTNPPITQITLNGLKIEMDKFKEAADRIGAGENDVLTIDGYRNAKGDFVPNYDSVRIVKKGNEND